jgi:hypothetical protein
MFLVKNRLDNQQLMKMSEHFSNSGDFANINASIDSAISKRLNTIAENEEEIKYDDYLITPGLYDDQDQNNSSINKKKTAKNKNKKNEQVKMKKSLNPYYTPPLGERINNALILPPDNDDKHPDEHSPLYANTLVKPMQFGTQSGNSNSTKETYVSLTESFMDSRMDGSPIPVSCQLKHEHGQCSYGITNYLDPCDMTPVDREIFKVSYPSKMTLQDYVNWLWLYYDTPDELSYDHIRNLKKLIIGEKLVYQAGILPPPGNKMPPVNAQEYFQKLYTINNMRQLNTILRNDTDGLQGYNYNDFANFYQNVNQYGKTGDASTFIENSNIAIQKNPEIIDQLLRPMLTPKKPNLSRYSTQSAKCNKYSNKIPNLQISIT